MFFSHLNRYKGCAAPWGGGVAVGEEPQNGEAGGLFGEFCLTVGEDNKAVRQLTLAFQPIKDAGKVCSATPTGNDGRQLRQVRKWLGRIYTGIEKAQISMDATACTEGGAAEISSKNRIFTVSALSSI